MADDLVSSMLQQAENKSPEKEQIKDKEKAPKLTLNDRFELFVGHVRPDNLPVDATGQYSNQISLCGATSPVRGFGCTAGLQHIPPHVASSKADGTPGAPILAVWDEPI